MKFTALSHSTSYITDVLEIMQCSILMIQHSMGESLAFITTFPVYAIDTSCRRLLPKPTHHFRRIVINNHWPLYISHVAAHIHRYAQVAGATPLASPEGGKIYSYEDHLIRVAATDTPGDRREADVRLVSCDFYLGGADVILGYPWLTQVGLLTN